MRLAQGDYARETVYASDPAGVALQFARSGAPRIHVVDLDGARDGLAANEPAIAQILESAGSVPVGRRTAGLFNPQTSVLRLPLVGSSDSLSPTLRMIGLSDSRRSDHPMIVHR